MFYMDPADLADFAINEVELNTTLIEFKYMESDLQIIQTRNGIVDNLTNSVSIGFGIRILKNGAWGFSSSNKLTKEQVKKCAKEASKLAEIASIRNPNIKLTNEPTIVDKRKNPIKIDPFHVEPSEKIEFFKDSIKEISHIKEIKFANSIYMARKDRMKFYNSEGANIDQEIVANGGYILLIAKGSNDVQTRKYRDDLFKTEGWELMKNSKFREELPEKAAELVDLLEAPNLKSAISDIILNPSQLGIQLHESCGHPSELDRAIGYEAAYAGTSFLKPELLKKKYKYGNEKVTINADATIPKALGSFYYDHEGVKGEKTTLVKEGLFNDYLSSRETASIIGRKHSSGSTRSIGYQHIPLVRMTNIVLQPDKHGQKLEEMIEETKDGYYFHTNRSWSIDDIRLNFQFGCEIGYKIKNGSIEGLVKNPTYTGITPEFWNSVLAVGKPDELEVLGTPFCGKGEPGQTMYTGHGGPPTKFQSVRVGVIN